MKKKIQLLFSLGNDNLNVRKGEIMHTVITGIADNLWHYY